MQASPDIKACARNIRCVKFISSKAKSLIEADPKLYSDTVNSLLDPVLNFCEDDTTTRHEARIEDVGGGHRSSSSSGSGPNVRSGNTTDPHLRLRSEIHSLPSDSLPSDSLSLSNSRSHSMIDHVGGGHRSSTSSGSGPNVRSGNTTDPHLHDQSELDFFPSDSVSHLDSRSCSVTEDVGGGHRSSYSSGCGPNVRYGNTTDPHLRLRSELDSPGNNFPDECHRSFYSSGCGPNVCSGNTTDTHQESYSQAESAHPSNSSYSTDMSENEEGSFSEFSVPKEINIMEDIDLFTGKSCHGRCIHGLTNNASSSDSSKNTSKCLLQCQMYS